MNKIYLKKEEKNITWGLENDVNVHRIIPTVDSIAFLVIARIFQERYGMLFLQR